jgi:hypothetical protein
MFTASACDACEDQREGKKQDNDGEDCVREKRRAVRWYLPPELDNINRNKRPTEVDAKKV